MRKIKELEEKLEIKDRIIKQIAEDFFNDGCKKVYYKCNYRIDHDKCVLIDKSEFIEIKGLEELINFYEEKVTELYKLEKELEKELENKPKKKRGFLWKRKI